MICVTLGCHEGDAMTTVLESLRRALFGGAP